jgi:hypothetical protein
MRTFASYATSLSSAHSAALTPTRRCISALDNSGSGLFSGQSIFFKLLNFIFTSIVKTAANPSFHADWQAAPAPQLHARRHWRQPVPRPDNVAILCPCYRFKLSAYGGPVGIHAARNRHSDFSLERQATVSNTFHPASVAIDQLNRYAVPVRVFAKFRPVIRVRAACAAGLAVDHDAEPCVPAELRGDEAAACPLNSALELGRHSLMTRDPEKLAIEHEAEIILLRALVVASIATHPNKAELKALFREMLSDAEEPVPNDEELTIEIRARGALYLKAIESAPD